MVSGIYMIYNTINGKFYIGSAVDLQNRINTHKSKLNLNQHPSKYLQSAYNKYGKESFQFLKIEYIYDKNDLLTHEQWWLDITHCWDRKIGYNSRKIVNSNLGLKFTMSDEWKRNIGLGNKGKTISEETRVRYSLAQKGKKLSEETKRKILVAREGYSHSQQTKNKIGFANSNKEKWPHEKGNACNCRECLDKKNKIRRDNRKQTFIWVNRNGQDYNTA